MFRIEFDVERKTFRDNELAKMPAPPPNASEKDRRRLETQRQDDAAELWKPSKTSNLERQAEEPSAQNHDDIPLDEDDESQDGRNSNDTDDTEDTCGHNHYDPNKLRTDDRPPPHLLSVIARACMPQGVAFESAFDSFGN